MFGADAARPPSDAPIVHTMGVGRLRALMITAAVMLGMALIGTSSALAAPTTTYSATQTIPVPPASDFAGSGGGDGWAVAMSSTQVFNVFHHSSGLTVACHLQTDASSCWSPKTISDASNNSFATSGQPGLYLDQTTGKLYVYATRSSDSTAGVVCVDTTIAATTANPFCGFTPLTPAGDAPLQAGISGTSGPMLVGSHWYAFNYVNGVNVIGAKNTLLCFDVSADAACSGQPFAVSIGAGTVSNGGFPSPATAAIRSQVIIPIHVGESDELACFDDTTQAGCSGSWPVATGTTYAGNNGSPFPLLDATGKITGLCLPTGTDQCYGLDGASATTPAGMSAVIGGTSGTSPWNGPGFVLGPRVYIPDGNANKVECYDYSTSAGCANFPKTFNNLGYLYTVNADPQRPTCIWVNADGGTSQIQNFDAYSGGACGQGAIRVLASQFVVAKQACYPTAYDALQVVSPAPSTYTSGTLAFQDGDGNPIAGASNLPLDGTGTVSLSGLNLNTPTGLPQFVIALAGESGSPGQVVVKLTWTAAYDPSCVGPGVTAAAPPAAPASGVTPPANVTPPTISGTPLPGNTLTCSPGQWTGSPTSYAYTWSRNGTAIGGATGSTYAVQIADEGTTLTCAVTGHNAGGDSSSIRSKGVVSGYRNALTCPKPSGKLHGTAVGAFTVGLTRSDARKRLTRYHVTHNGFDNFCLYAGWGIRVGYPSTELLRTLAPAARRGLKGRIVLALTANPFYALEGVRPGMKLTAVANRLHVGKPFHVGRNFWYFVPGKTARGVLKVRGGVIQEVGLASIALTGSRDAERRFIRSFKDG